LTVLYCTGLYCTVLFLTELKGPCRKDGPFLPNLQETFLSKKRTFLTGFTTFSKNHGPGTVYLAKKQGKTVVKQW